MSNFRRVSSGGRGVRLVVAWTALILAWPTGPAGAQSCKDLPAGPARRECTTKNHSGLFEKKQERCLELARQNGATGRGSGQKGFMQSCMQGKVSP